MKVTDPEAVAVRRCQMPSKRTQEAPHTGETQRKEGASRTLTHPSLAVRRKWGITAGSPYKNRPFWA
jgi:hypothetical protein